MSQFDWIVFDLGGVFVDFDANAIVDGYQRHAPLPKGEVAELLSGPDGPLTRWGIGEISAQEYFNLVDGALGIALSEEEHKRIDLSHLLGERPDMVKLLEGLKDCYKLACFSNTHDLHWDHMLRNYRCMSYFEKKVASHLIRARKPSPKAYQRLLSQISVQASACLFIDDALENIEAARVAGFQAILFSSLPTLVADLNNLGCDVRL